ncbi:conjugal transfer nickase/helicase domain-containing protein [Avibacterium endocarditidis]|uniref:conjugal transfer nickase/helicase domain-containing protein n=1 Tax=Avibacterium endocarditidis TaxID=380674 RepID=UPI001FE6A3C1|nr:DNA-binding domain-containing protein [Avibacterium endocarditidis]
MDKNKLLNNKLTFNDRTAKVHIVNDCLFIVSPSSFELYLQEKGEYFYEESINNLQYEFQALGLHRKRVIKDDSVNFWRCYVIYPNEITRTHLLNWRNTVVGEGIKPITWNSYLRNLKCLYKFGIEQKLLDYKENPCNKLFLWTGKAKRKTLTDCQLQKLELFS